MSKLTITGEFKISPKNSFVTIIKVLGIKGNRTIFIWNNNVKISKLPTRLAWKMFQSQISPLSSYMGVNYRL